MNKYRILLTISLLVLLGDFVSAQSIDGIVAIVGKEIIMRSDIEADFLRYSEQYAVVEDPDMVRCDIFERLLTEKLMLHQGDIDSVVFSDQQVEDQLNYRISMLLQQVGGDSKILEEYYHKSLEEIKKELRDVMHTQLIVDEVQRNLTQNITITPTEVKTFFEQLDYDSLPTIPTTYELGDIVKTPPVSEDEKAAIRQRLNEFRERVLRGEKFSMLARLYSDDPGSASKGGDLGFAERGTFYPEFESAAFKLKSGEISPVIQTQAGYHIIQMIERRGDKINVAHILLQPKPSPEEQVKAIEYLDSIKQVILADTLSFEKAVRRYSDGSNKNNGGLLVNPYSGSSKFEKEALEPATFAVVNKLIPGEYSEPVPFVTEDGNMAYRLLYLKERVSAHKPNLIEDYDVIKNAALDDKKQKTVKKWIKTKVKSTSIKINKDYQYCDFLKDWKIIED